MRTAPLVLLAPAAFVLASLAPPAALTATAAAPNPPAFLRTCDGTRSPGPIGPYGIAVSDDAVPRLFVVQVFVSSVLTMVSPCSIDATFGAGMTAPAGIAFVSALDRVYVVDRGNSRIMAYSSTGAFLFSFGAAGALPGELQFPCGIAQSPSSGLLYVADTFNNRIQTFDADGNVQGQWGTAGTGNGEFSFPRGIAIDAAGNVYVSDTDNDRVQKFTAAGTYLLQWGTGGSGDGEFDAPNGLAIGPADDGAGMTEAVYVVDTGNGRVQVFSGDGAYLSQFGSTGSAAGQFLGPADVDIDGNGEIHVTDQYNQRVQVFGYPVAVTGSTWAGIKAGYRGAATR